MQDSYKRLKKLKASNLSGKREGGGKREGQPSKTAGRHI
jgi:hypothetical protein